MTGERHEIGQLLVVALQIRSCSDGRHAMTQRVNPSTLRLSLSVLTARRSTPRQVPPMPLLTLEDGRPRSRAEKKIKKQRPIFFSEGSLDLGP
jgi:hypothetical protein